MENDYYLSSWLFLSLGLCHHVSLNVLQRNIIWIRSIMAQLISFTIAASLWGIFHHSLTDSLANVTLRMPCHQDYKTHPSPSFPLNSWYPFQGRWLQWPLTISLPVALPCCLLASWGWRSASSSLPWRQDHPSSLTRKDRLDPSETVKLHKVMSCKQYPKHKYITELYIQVNSVH